MSYDYQPQIEEKDDGYSIPKILVAVLLLVVIGAAAYIYLQQKKLTTSVAYLKNAKKQVELDLNSMIEKYNLAINDNDFLADELREERDGIIRYRDSIKNINGEDFSRITNYEEKIRNLKKQSAIVFESTPAKTIQDSNVEELEPPVEEVVTEVIEKDTKPKNTPANNQNTSTPKIVKEETVTNNIVSTNDIASTEETVAVNTTPVLEPVKVVEKVKKEEPKVETLPKKTTTNFIRVEIPPTYPGCKGNATEKKACFTKKVKKHLERRFDASIIEDLDIKSGKKRIWVTFDVDKFGNVTNVNARSPKDMSNNAKKKLESEAIRAIKKLPKMTAARQNGKSVKINYSVPITFRVP